MGSPEQRKLDMGFQTRRTICDDRVSIHLIDAMKIYYTFTFRMLQESQAFRRRLPFCVSPPLADAGGGGGIDCCASPSPCPFA